MSGDVQAEVEGDEKPQRRKRRKRSAAPADIICDEVGDEHPNNSGFKQETIRTV